MLKKKQRTFLLDASTRTPPASEFQGECALKL